MEQGAGRDAAEYGGRAVWGLGRLTSMWSDLGGEKVGGGNFRGLVGEGLWGRNNLLSRCDPSSVSILVSILVS